MTLRLNSSTSGYTELDAPAVGGNNTLRLPGDNGTSGYLMQTDGSGNLSWRDPSSLLSPSRNRIINGDMRIDQRNAGASVTPGAAAVTYTLDRWGAYEDTDGSITVQQSSTAPAGFTKSLLLTVTSADTSLAATQRTVLYQYIEGFNISDWNFGTASAVTITLSFWARSSVTGTFGGSYRSGTGPTFTGYAFTYTINAANTWEYKTVVIPGATSGSWATDNTAGSTLLFGFGVGSTYSASAGTWTASDVNSATGATNLMATNGATFHITGVQLEAGTTATPFERRSYGQELALCQRYLSPAQVVFNANNQGGAGAPFAQTFTFPAMRTAPTFTTNTAAANTNAAATTIDTISVNMARMYSTTVASGNVIINYTGFAQSEL